MAGVIEVQILHIVGPIESCQSTQFGIELTVNPVTGFRMWGGKDASGAVTRWLALDKAARVTTMEATSGFTGPHIDLDTAGGATPVAGRLSWNEDENVPQVSDQTDDVEVLLGKWVMTPRLRNNSGGVITKGTVCAVGPVSGGVLTMYPVGTGNYVANDYIVFAVRDIANGAIGDALWVGKLSGVDTSAFSSNDALYLSSTAGVLNNTPGTPGVMVARCVDVSATEGSIVVVGAGVGGSSVVPTHASQHENGGSDEIDVTGLSGVLADAQTPSAHASTHAAGSSDPIDAADLTGIGAIGNAFDISDAITGNPHAKIEQRNATEIESYTLDTGVSSVGNGRSVRCEECLVYNNAGDSDLLEKRDRFNGKLIDTFLPSTVTGGRAIVCRDGVICIILPDAIWEVPAGTFDSASAITATGVLDSVSRGADLGPNDDIYSLSSSSTTTVYKSVRGSVSYTVTPYTLSGTTLLYDIIFTPDRNYFYVVDTNVVRKYDTATRTLQASSSALPGTYLNSWVFGFVGENVCIALSGNMYLLHPDTLVILQTSSSAITGQFGNVLDGTIRTFDASNMYVYQPAALTVQSPAHFDGYNIDSSAIAQLRGADGNRIVHSFADFQRSEITGAANDETRLGVDVISAVQSTDSEITNITVGQRYLILEVAASYPLHNHLAEKRSDGLYFYKPKLNDLVSIQTSGYMLRFDGSSWTAVEILTRVNAINLTDTGDTTLHYHAADRSRANHTGTQTASTISDFDTEVSNNTDVAANTSARHSHANKTLLDTLVAGMILSEAQKTDLTYSGASTAHYHTADRERVNHTGSFRVVSATDEIELTDRYGVVHVTDARTADVALSIDAAVLAIDGFEFSVLVDYDASYIADLYAPTSSNTWQMNGDSSSGRPLAYRFVIEGGAPHPFGTMPTFNAS